MGLGHHLSPHNVLSSTNKNIRVIHDGGHNQY
jgi:hypothetical protein